MDFPFETTTKDDRKATVLGAMPDGRLVGFIMREDGTSFSWVWEADGGVGYNQSITLPLQIKPLTTYRMRNGGIAWTSGKIRNGLIYGMDANGDVWRWRVAGGRLSDEKETTYDLIEEFPPGTTD